jgi:ligand-binding sensor domain-containing protein/serine phosphatase RsbU (regulator of sigma subunit)
MRFNCTLKIFYSSIGCLFLFASTLYGQTYSFKNYSAESSIPSGFVYTLTQSKDGFLWVGTASGISRFDGYSFYNVPYPDSTTNRYPTAAIADKNGTLWFGCSDGSVFYVKENTLIPITVSNSKSVSEVVEGPDGFIYVIPQGQPVLGINPLNPKEIKKYALSEDPVMLSASFTNSGNLLIGTQNNVLECKLANDSAFILHAIEGFDYSSVTAIHKTEDSTRFIVGTKDNGLFQLRLSGRSRLLSRFRNHPEWDMLNIQSVTDDSEHNLWISTSGSGVFQVRLSPNSESAVTNCFYNTDSGLTSNDVNTVFQDAEGNYWIAFYGQGISMLTSYAFGYYKPGKNSVENNILYVNSVNDGYLLGTPQGFHLFNPVIGKSVSFTDLSGQVGKKEINCYYLDNQKNLWIGTAGNGLFMRNKSGEVKLIHQSGDSGADDIKDIKMDSKYIWLATTNGAILLDKRATDTKSEKLRFDLSNGLPHNSINSILLAKDGNVYIGTESDRLFKIDKDFNVSASNSVMTGSTKNKVLSLSQNFDTIIWIATNGNGAFEFINDTVKVINRSNDLMSNYCYSILSDSENNIWIGHDKGFSRFISNIGTMTTYGTDFAKGGQSNPNGMFESADRKIFVGTTEGLIIYDKNKDIKQNVAPLTSINSITINDVIYPYQKSFSLPYNKKYLITVSFSAINFSAPDKVYYSTFMENLDNDWSKFNTLREVTYNLRDGKYKFNLISVNKDGMSQEVPASFEISIKKPVWRTWWFILGVLSAVTGIIVLIIRERDKAQKKIQEYLETELAARTSIVVKQKEEIELQNIGITDSINYAKRIQSNILPDINKLKESFNDAFVLFHPRDIVSGDFYWFDKLEEDKFVIVCADSTGHGVPGAFMSMIGSTLLQDIVTRKRISKPSQILTLLDKQIFSTLNQNVELGVSNDGMDMVVCEFNIKTRHLRFASAMRPVIIVIDGEPYYIKGNRSSVGGESAIEKYFDDQEYYLSKGDTVYLFSDGLPDQFGGTDGKKMKIARLKRLIEQVSKLPMDEQKDAIAKFYFEWKGTFDQVDDILIMGIKV